MDLKKQCRQGFLFSLFIVAAFANLGKIISSSELIPCEEGSYFFGGKCYKIFGEKGGLVWNEASSFCKTINGSLVTIDSKELQDFLTPFFILATNLDVYIGLNDRQVESFYRWDDGSFVEYTNWEPGEPSGMRDHEEDCVEIRIKSKGKIGTWNDCKCNIPLPFICQSNKSKEILSHDSRFCSIEKGGGWKYFNSCYHIVDVEKSWEEAEKYCQENFKGHLLTILGSKEETFLDYVLHNFAKDFWIGIKMLNPTQLKWTSGWHVIYHNWSPHIQLDDPDHRHFVNDTCALKSKGQSWTSTSCSQKNSFICEASSDKPVVLKKGLEGWKCPELSMAWRDLGGDKCYIFEKHAMAWYEANYVCATKGGTLAVIESEAENKALHRYTIESRDAMFIGLHRGRIEEVFEWVDGTKSEYRNWLPGEPNNNNEKCAEIRTESMLWNDIPCSETKRFICSAQKIPPTVTKKKETDVKDRLYQAQCNRSGDMSLQTMFMVLVGIVIISLVFGLVIYNFKSLFPKGIKHFHLKDAEESASFPTPEDSCELI